MRVKELISLLGAAHPESEVWVENKGECRRLEPIDITVTTLVCDVDAGELAQAGDRPEHGGHTQFVVLGSWR